MKDQAELRQEVENALNMLTTMPVSAEAIAALRAAVNAAPALGGQAGNLPHTSSMDSTAASPHEGALSSSSTSKLAKEEDGEDGEAKGKDGDKPKRTRQPLSPDQAIQIFQLRPKQTIDGSMRRGSMLHCKVIAPQFGVTPKTVRDIWNGRTWASVTKHLWSKAERNRKAYFLQDVCDEEGGMGMSPMVMGMSMDGMPQGMGGPGMGALHGMVLAPGGEGMMYPGQMQGYFGQQGMRPFSQMQPSQHPMLYKAFDVNNPHSLVAGGGQAGVMHSQQESMQRAQAGGSASAPGQQQQQGADYSAQARRIPGME